MNKRAQGHIDRTVRGPTGRARSGSATGRSRTLRPANDNQAPLAKRLVWLVGSGLLLLAAGAAIGALLD
jgi:hypothetical protein